MLSKLLYRIPKTYHLLLIAVMSALVAISVGLFVNYLLPAPSPSSAPPTTPRSTASGLLITPLTSEKVVIPPNPAPTAQSPTIPEPDDDLPNSKHNHLPYEQANDARIVSIGSFVRESYEREEFLDADAAQAFQVMANVATADGISLIPISGFRTVEHQAELFAKQVKKLGSESAAAQVSAPPGHSEHHTGYAIDMGDTNYPDADITYAFENTPAYQWLLIHAGIYGFELSFPKGNQQGVSFEPWHWRYIGSLDAAKTFSP